VQGSKLTDQYMLAPDKSSLSIEVQLGYVIAEYAARVSLGFQHVKTDTLQSNQIYLGAQFLK
jgi:hypothetical protein